MNSRIRAISFDLDDTLWELAPVIYRAEAVLRDWLNEHHPQFAAHYPENQLRELRIEMIKKEPHWMGDVSEMRKEALRRAAEDVGYPTLFIEEAFRVFLEARNQVAFYDDALPVLDQLAKSDRYKLAALTNGNANLEQVGLDHLFHLEVSATFDMPMKPNPDMFYYTCEVFDIAPLQLLHVGDSPKSDVLGAQRAGVKTVWLNRRAEDWPDDLEPPDFELTSLNGLLGILVEADGI